MKQLLFLLLFPCLAMAQYQGNAGQKITLGEQTTADGLVYRGLASDTTRKPSVDTMAYILLDTNTNIIWQYKKATNNAWTRLNLRQSDTTSFNYVNTYGTQTVNGAKTLTSNLILKNSQEPSRAEFIGNQQFAADTTNWTRGTGWTFSGGVAVATAATGDLTYITLPDTIISGRAYEITYTQSSYLSGTATIALGNVTLAIPQYNMTANIILLLPTSATGGFRITTSTYTGNLDNISIVEISNQSPILFAGQDDGSTTLYSSLRMPNSTTFAFGGGVSYTTGNNNVANGSNALLSNTTGSSNVANGANALLSNTTGNSNVANGSNALLSNTTGSSNVANGVNTLRFNTRGASNVANGGNALQFNTGGFNNVANGGNALQSNTTGSDNVANGLNALRSNTTGNNNIANGSNAMYNTTVGDTLTGSNNIAIGFNAADNIRFAASGNVVIGNAVDLPVQNGSNQVVIKNIIFATGASGTGTIIAGSVGIGTNAPTARLHVKGSGVATGETFKIENSGGTNLLTVLDNGFVGIGTPTPTTQMQLVGSTFSIIRVSSGAGNVSRFDFGTQSSPDIGRLTFSNADSSIRIRPGLEASELSLLKNGNLGISVATPTQKLHVGGNGLFTGSITTNSLTTNGIVYSNAGTLTNTNPSDSTLKNSINSYTYGLSEILQLKPKTFYYNLDVTRSHLKYGFIAQEVQPIMPDLVRIIGNGSDKLGLESEGIYVAMVNAIKELSAEIDILKQEIINLKNK